MEHEPVVSSKPSNWDELIEKAANAIIDSNYLLLATGAGFSADSGLAVYKDIANVPAYHKLNLEYHDICVPSWIEKDPELFFGFWGACFNDYRKTKPHEGYHIIKSWKDKLFHNKTPAAEKLDNKKSQKITDLDEKMSNLSIEGKAGPFFIYTSNVDNHSQTVGFSPNEIYNIHGTTEVWQCSVPCEQAIWKVPSNFVFEVDKSTMKAPPKRTKELEETVTEKGWTENHPTCIYCGKLARPAILMFGDWLWISVKEESRNYYEWRRKVESVLGDDNKSKVTILEVGCGKNVPTVRYQSESCLGMFPKGQCTLIRVNPDFPEAPKSITEKRKENIISIKAKGLETIKAIDEKIKEKLAKKNSN